MICGFTNLLRTTVVLTVVFVSAGCRNGTSRPADSGMRDDTGRAVLVERSVERIVSLAPNVTEILYAIGAGSKLVGVDDFSNHPAEAKRLPRLGGMSPSAEKIAELRPDLVFASTSANQPSLPAILDSLGIPLYVTRAERLSEVGPLIDRIGKVAGVDARDVVSRFQTELELQRRARVRPPRVLFVIWHDPLYVSGRETFADDLIALTGGENHVDPRIKGWPQYSYERVVADAPDIVVVAGPGQVLEAVRARIRREDVMYQLVSEDIYSRPGPRLVNAATELNAIFDRWNQGR